MQFKVLPTACPEWDAFCAQHSGLIFHRCVWWEVLQRGLRYPVFACTLWKGDRLVLGLPVFLMNYKIVKLLHATIPYGTVLGDSRALPDFFVALHRFLAQQGIDALLLGGGFPGSLPLVLSGYTPRVHPIHLLSLRGKSTADLWKGYKSYTRRAVRKAQKSGVQVTSIQERSEIEDFYTLYLLAMKRNRAAAKYPRTLFYAIYDLLIATGNGDVLFATLGEKKIAGIMLLYSNNAAHYYFGGSDPSYYKYHPNDALFHAAISEACALHKDLFDFMGSDAKDTQLMHFKAKWGALPYTLPFYEVVRRRSRYALWTTGRRILTAPVGSACIRLWQRIRS